MGGVCSVRRNNGDGSPLDVGDGGAPPSYFDVAWEEDEAYAPISGGEINIGDGSGYARGGSTAAATTAIRDRPAPATSATATVTVVAGACAGGAGDGAGGDWGGSGLVVPRWPALAEEHLSRLYSNDDGCRASPSGGGRSEPLALVELCVRSICRRLGDYRRFPSFLPREVVDTMVDSLTKHRALSCYTLGAFRDCEVTSLALGECRGVRNGWVRELLGATPCGRFIVTLDLSGCTGLTDTGLSKLLALESLESASLRHCSGLGAEATLCLSNSPGLERLSLAHCPLQDDAAIGNLAGLERLRSLELEGCENISDEGLRLACRLPSLTCLNASRCHGITLEGLAALGNAKDRLQRLNLGWCMGLARAPGLSSGDADDYGYDDESGDDENDGGDGDGGEERRGESRRRRRRRGRRSAEWALPVLPKLERLCLARLVLRDRGPGPDGVRPADRARGGKALFPPSPRVLEPQRLQVQNIARQLPGLTALNLDRCSVGDVGARALSSLVNLERLNLAETAISDSGMTHLAPLTRLKDLSLFFCKITDAGLGPLAALTGLVRLNLDMEDVGDAGMVQLSRLRLLESLDVFSASVSDYGVAHGLTRLPSLTSLEVCSGRLTDRGLYHLSRVKSLTRLNVSQNLGVTAAGVRHVGTLTGLRALNLSSCSVTPASLDSLTDLVHLESLSVYGCRLEMSDLEQLRGKLPNLRVVRAD
ncbi:unnamed protein product [Pylaiella littoralis]